MIACSHDREVAVATLPLDAPPSDSVASGPRLIFVSTGFRLDNRSQLAGKLSMPEDADDEAILTAGWQEWGEALPDRLRGAFAFALYLPDTAAIFAARDIFGLCPLYYALSDGHLTLASTCRAVRSLQTKAPHPNELMLADFVNGVSLEHSQTFFEGIYRLPPAHHMSVKLETTGVATHRYWAMGDVARDVSPDDAPQRFRRLFDNAVTNCITAKTPALLISGGMDSSSIAASMRALNTDAKCHAAAMTFPDTADWHDGPYLREISKSAALDLIEVPSEEHDPLEDMETWLEAMDGPYLPYGHSISFRLVPLLGEKGFDCVLSGHGGDEIVSHGFGRLNELALGGRWLRFWRESTAAAHLYENFRTSRWTILRRYLSHFQLIRLWRWLRSKIGTQSAPPAAPSTWLSAPLAQRLGPQRYQIRQAATRRDHNERMLQEEAMGLALQPQSLEVYAVCAKLADVEMRFPFYDRDLFEFSLSLGSDWKLRNGFSRYILRAAMGDDLPSAIRQRVDKYDFARHFIDGLKKVRNKVLSLTDPERGTFTHLVNLEKLAHARDTLATNDAGLDRDECFFLWRVAVLGIWLDIAKRPITKPKLITFL